MTDRPILRRGALWLAAAALAVVALAALTAAARQNGPPAPAPPVVGSMAGSLGLDHGAVRAAVAGHGPRSAAGAVADGYIAAARLAPPCQASPRRMVRSGPNKYALGRCSTRAAAGSRQLPRPKTRLLKESAFASLIADNTCVTSACADEASAARATWVLTGGRTGVRPRTTAACPRYKNIDFATDRAIPEDRLLRVIPRDRQVLWRYASRGGGWVMAHWSGGAPYSWAFIPRSCVADPPTWSQIGLWKHEHRAAGRHRPTSGRRFRLLRPALPCASRLRCRAAVPAR